MTNIKEILKEFDNLPRFDDGRINYKGHKKSVGIFCCVKYRDEILLLKRSDKVATYKNKWSCVTGYYDEPVPVIDKIMEELSEEIVLDENDILKIREYDSWIFRDPPNKTISIQFPVLVELITKPEVKLNWEHTDYKWVKKEEVNSYDTVLNVKSNLDIILA